MTGLSEEQFNRLLRARRAEPAPAAPAPAAEAGAISPAQLEILIADAVVPAYQLSEAYDVEGPLDLAALERGARMLLERQPVLHTVYRRNESGFTAQVQDIPDVVVAFEDYQGPEPDAADRVVELCRIPFDLEVDAPLRISVLRLGERHHVLVLQAHHVAVDGASWSVLLNEFARCYGAAADGKPLPPQIGTYRHYIALTERREAEGVNARFEQYWKAELTPLPAPLILPDPRRRPAPPTRRGEGVAVLLDRALADETATLARGLAVSRVVLQLTAYAAALSALTGQLDLVVGVPMVDRPLHELDEVVGTYVSTLPIRIALRPGESWRDLIETVRARLSTAMAHPLPLSRIVEHVGARSAPDLAPVVQALFNSHAFGLRELRLGEAEVTARRGRPNTSRFDVSLVAVERADLAVYQLVTNADTVAEPVASSLLGHTLRNLRALVADPSAPHDIRPENAAAIEAMETEPAAPWSVLDQPDLPTQRPTCAADLLDLIRDHVRRAPEHPAVRHEHGTLDYAALLGRSDALSEMLRAHGVRPGDRVVIALPAGCAAAVATLAVLSSSAVCVAVDPGWPAEYLAAALRRLAPRVGVGRGRPDALAAEALPWIEVGPDGGAISGATGEDRGGTTPASGEPDPFAAGFIVLTSGTSGRPKQVLVGAEALAHRLRWSQAEHPLVPEDVVALLTPPTFDFSYWEMIAPLAAGATLAAVPEGANADGCRS